MSNKDFKEKGYHSKSEMKRIEHMKENKMTKEIKEEKNLWNDLDLAMLRAKQILGGELTLPTDKDSQEVGLMRMVEAIEKLCDRIESPRIIRV